MNSRFLSHDEQVDAALAALTLEEKAALLSGADFWHTAAIERVGVPGIMVTDGPYGLRKQPTDGSDSLGIGGSTPATCFPPPVALGSSFDPELGERVGAAIGEEAKQEQVAVVLGPGINIKRSPLCGRNFEYYSEDPYVAGVFGAAWVRGIQSQGIGSSLKHFAVNSQETRRMTVSADVDARPLHEIYLRGFRTVVRAASPWTVMCSYNRINGVYASENRHLLTEILRDEWGYDGLVVSDWGAVLDRARAVSAGLDLEMPSSGSFGPAAIISAVRDGSVDEAVVDASVRRVLRLVFTAAAEADPAARYDVDAHHRLAREAATRGAVLLKNEGGLLPLDPATASIAVIGEFARTPRFQGAGSSQIVPTQLDTALDAIRETAAGAVTFAPGFTLDDEPNEALAAEAVAAAAGAEVAVVFLGLPSSYESEGYDREHIDLPETQVDVLRQVVAANPRTVVVLSNGSVVRVAPWIAAVPAVLEGWLLGQAGGSATADLLFGAVNPSGRLTETLPVRLEDNPSYLNFPGDGDRVLYGEGIFVGYRWYDAKNIEVSFPFGHGLSYTQFSYGALEVSANPDGLSVAFDVTNVGERAGREIAQVYVSAAFSRVARPVRELKGFSAVDLEPGQSKRVTVSISRDDLAYYDDRVSAWLVEEGEYRVEVGASSRDLRLHQAVEVAGDAYVPPLTINSTVDEWLTHPVGGPLLQAKFAQFASQLGNGESQDGNFLLKMLGGMRLGQLPMFPATSITNDEVARIVSEADAATRGSAA